MPRIRGYWRWRGLEPWILLRHLGSYAGDLPLAAHVNTKRKIPHLEVTGRRLDVAFPAPCLLFIDLYPVALVNQQQAQ